MTMIKLEVEEWGGACPFQANGKINGFPFYFRARHGMWTLEVARVGEDPVGNPTVYFAQGSDRTGGYMKHKTAAMLLGREAWKFKQSTWSCSVAGAEAPSA